jgi:prepilin-type N-terminal cleavage/methylation domain-containing protein
MMESSKFKVQSSKNKEWFTTTTLDSCGFTLIELLVTIGIIVVVGTIVTSILVSTLRGSTKATILAIVKQNGDAAISQFSRTVRSASTLNLVPCGNPSPATQTLTVTKIDNTQTTFDCTGSTINVNGNSLLDTNTVKLVPSSCSIICRQQTINDAPIIQIQFSLMQNSSGNFAEQAATIPFQTSVVLRNIQQ